MITVTHKGWVGMCPVYFTPLDGRQTAVCTRGRIPGFWLFINEVISSIVNMGAPRLRETGELKSPITYTDVTLQRGDY